MAGTKAASVAEYIDALPREQREAVGAVRTVILDNLPKGFTESVGFGMINYGVPLSRFPDTYNGQPLCYAALAASVDEYIDFYRSSRKKK